jgi:hypothetical protein
MTFQPNHIRLIIISIYSSKISKSSKILDEALLLIITSNTLLSNKLQYGL